MLRSRMRVRFSLGVVLPVLAFVPILVSLTVVTASASASVAMNRAVITGQYTNSAGQTAETACTIGIRSDTRARVDDTDDIYLESTVNCATGNVSIVGNSTLYQDVGRSVLTIASDFSPTVSPNATSRGYFYETSPARVKFYQLHVVLTINSAGPARWTAEADGCSGIGTGRAECFLSVRFPGPGSEIDSATAIAGKETYDLAPAAVDAPPPTGLEDQIGAATGVEDGAGGGIALIEGVQPLFYITEDTTLHRQLQSGQISLDQARRQRGLITCFFTYRRKKARAVIPTPRRATVRYFYNFGARLKCQQPIDMAVQARLKYFGTSTTASTADRVPGVGTTFSDNEFSGRVADFPTRRRFFVQGIFNATAPRGSIVGVVPPNDIDGEEEPECDVSPDWTRARCVVNSEPFS